MHTSTRCVSIGSANFANYLPFALIAGPCQLESLQHSLDIAGRLVECCTERGVEFVFKASFDKANRSSHSSIRGVGLEQAKRIFTELRRALGVPVITDIHDAEQAAEIAPCVDALQIPALLCRQTDLVQAAAKTGLPLNIKKGQFLSPQEMKNVAAKAEAVGNSKVLICERGTSFGYNTLINDFRGVEIMKETTSCPVVFDATHSVQQPGSLGSATGGERRYVPILARAAIAVGVAGIFIETHDDPDKAPSDGPNMLELGDVPEFLDRLIELDTVVKSWGYGSAST